MILTPEFRVTTDKYNHILEHLQNSKKKDTEEIVKKWVQVGFYGNLKQAIKAAMKKDLRNCDTLQEVLDRVDRFERYVDEMFEIDKIDDEERRSA